jgi:hypothetical protein
MSLIPPSLLLLLLADTGGFLLLLGWADWGPGLPPAEEGAADAA